MAANTIVYNYDEMQKAVTALIKAKQEYTNAANTLKTALGNATNSWTGLSKDKFTTLSESVYEYLGVSVPGIIEGLISLLENSTNVMAETDSQISQYIPDKL